jgi:hypothetical protein
MPNSEHLGELAELYALGTLGDLDRVRVERHLRTCAACSARVGEAESTVLQLMQTDAAAPPALPPRALTFTVPSRRAPEWIAAVAAAFLIGLIPWGVTLTRERGAAADAGTQRQASAAMLAGHFAHVPFRPRTPSAPAAKAIYPREGGWLYVIVGPGKDALDIAVVRGARRTTVATVAAATETRAVFVAVRDRIDGVLLLDGDAAVASARIAY